MGNQYVYLTVHGIPRHILTVDKCVALDAPPKCLGQAHQNMKTIEPEMTSGQFMEGLRIPQK